ncbi:MAG TPA: hypothetical protein GXZ91_02985 [Christensenellaceae bacterium]|jgi:menaquinone-dependent protoporphyrinogen IX oxidase|nr:hypothetical protein [Christensenellaceae bacterium]
MKKIVIYKSKYGATKRYALCIADKLICDAVSMDAISPEKLNNYDIIIIGSHIRMFKICFSGFVHTYADILKNKKIVFFAVGAMPPETPKEQEKLRAEALDNFLTDAPLYYLKGVWNKEDMTFFDRLIANIAEKAILKKFPEKLAEFKESGFNESAIAPITESVQEIEKG